MIHKVSCLCVHHSASLSNIFTLPSVVVCRPLSCQRTVVLHCTSWCVRLQQHKHTQLLAAPPKPVFMLTVLLVSHGDFHITSCVARHHFCGTSAGRAPFFCVTWCVEEKCTIVQVFLTTIFRDILTQRKMLQPFKILSLWKELCKKQPLDKVPASGFDFSTLSASMMQYYLSGDPII